MRVLFTDKGISFQKYGGVSRYFCEIIKCMSMAQNIECDISALFFDNQYFSEYYDNRKIRHFKPLWKIGKVINRAFAIKLYLSNRYDIIHHTYYNYFPEFLFKKSKHVITIHDMIPELGFFDDRKLIIEKKKNIYNADHIIAVSECTKKDILRIYPDIPSGKITVIYHGCSLDPSMESEISLPQKYILFVGQRKAYKNFERLLYAFADLAKDYPDLFLVCFGGGCCNESEQQIISKLGINERVRFVSGTDKELTYTYHNARCFVYPSLYEGFGIPILESWACECPVVLSDASCFPEIAGDAAEYFAPYSSDKMASTIRCLIDSEEKREHLRLLGKERLEKYSWSIAAEKTITVYESLISKTC